LKESIWWQEMCRFWQFFESGFHESAWDGLVSGRILQKAGWVAWPVLLRMPHYRSVLFCGRKRRSAENIPRCLTETFNIWLKVIMPRITYHLQTVYQVS